jgi:hypothetical protein
LIEPASLTIGPDNETAYVAAERADAILTFDRDPSSGELVQKAGTAACISNTGLSDPMQADTVGDCVNGVAMDGVSSVAVLPDGTALYATTVESSGVAVFERLPNGELSQRPGTAGCVTETGFEDSVLPWTAGVCQDGRGLQRASSVTVSSDSLHAYTTASQGGIGIFDVVEPPPAPPPPPPPPPPTPPAPEGPECEEARKAERRLARALPRNQRLMRRQIRKARQAKTAAEEARHRKAARRTRKRTRVLRRAWLRVSRLALSACYR